MNFDHQNTDVCEDISSDLIEFALGTLTGRSRSRVLEHLATCAHCRGELESLAAVADALLELAPVAEPPLGFEQRLVERYRGEAPRQRAHRRVRLMSLAAAALVLVTLGFVVGNAVTSRDSTSPTTAVAPPLTAQFTSQGHVLGNVFVSSSDPAWIYMTFEEGNWSGTAWCRVTMKSGVVKELGNFSLTNGYGAWDAQINAPGNQIATAQVTNASGQVLATANLTA
jgi:hypothetical protein